MGILDDILDSYNTDTFFESDDSMEFDDKDFDTNSVAKEDGDYEDDDVDPYFGDYDDDEDDYPSDDDIDEFDALTDVDAKQQASLDSEEEYEADKYMSIMATQQLIKDEMNQDDKEKFIESAIDMSIAVNEGLLREDELAEIKESVDLGAMNDGDIYATEGKGYSNKMVIKLNKQARLKQLYAIGVYASARANHDHDFNKLMILQEKKRAIKKKLYQKYDAQAKKRMKIYFRKLQQTKSTPIKNMAKKIIK